MKNTKQILKLIKKLSGDERIYVVGGWLRDKLLGRLNRDLDIASLKDPLRLAKKFANKVKGKLIILDKNNKIYRVILKGHKELEYVDFAKMKGPDIFSDLPKRDFTINSFAAEISANGGLETSKPIDPCSGTRDLKKKLVRMTCPQSFKDDPLRMLRAFRIASELGFKIEPLTASAIKRDAKLIVKSAPERTRDELTRIFSNDHSAEWVSLLDRSTLLEQLLPEITPMKRSARKFYFHPNGLWQHCFETLESIESIFLELNKYFGIERPQIEAHLREPLSAGTDRKILLKYVALLHDCAKPECAKRCAGKTRFLGHEKGGAAKIGKIFARLKMGKKETQIAKLLVENHMRPVSLSQTGTVTQRASFRLFRDIGANTPDLLLLALADWHSYKRIKTGKSKNLKMQEAVLKELISRYYAHLKKLDTPKIIDGNIIMNNLKLEPGPIIGQLLRLVAEAQALGKINTKAEALALALRVLRRKHLDS